MSIMQEIQAQTAKTHACPRHDFGSWDNRPMFSKLRCSHCGCEWRMGDIGTYIRGYEAAGGNGADVLRDWAQPANARIEPNRPR